MSEINRRLLDSEGNIVYPITKAENIIHLQKTVLPKLSDEEPEIKVKGKVWLEPAESVNLEDILEDTSEMLTFGTPNNEPLTFAFNNDTNGLTFATSNSNENLTFNEPSEEELVFGSDNELTFNTPTNETLTFEN